MTGASGDIGGAIAVALAAEGCRIAATYVGFADGAQSVVRHGAGRPAWTPTRCSSTSATRRRSTPCAAWVVERFGGCDILVNNAAWNIGIPFPELDLLDAGTWDRVLETNLRGPFLLSRALAPHLTRRATAGGSSTSPRSAG